MMNPTMPQYNPATDTSLRGWWDASVPSAVMGAGHSPAVGGAEVLEWVNLANPGYGNLVVWSGVAPGPVLVTANALLNNKRSIVSTGTQLLATPDAILPKSMSGLTAVVVRLDSEPSLNRFCFVVAQNTGGGIRLGCGPSNTNRSTGKRLDADANQLFGDYTPGTGTNQAHIHTLAINYAAAQSQQHINGILRNEAVFSTAGTTENTDPRIISAFGIYSVTDTLTFPWSGAIAEIMLFPKHMTSDDLVPVHTYLRLKWGLY